MASREEIFKAAAAKREEEKDKEANRGTGFSFEELEYTALAQGEFRVLRLLGNPLSARQGDPFSPKTVLRSDIVADNKKKIKVNWPSREENENWILYQVMDKVLGYKWDSKANKRKYFLEESHPEIFQQVLKNGIAESVNKYESGWKPKSVVLMNVIDRARMDWHQENKKTLILSRNCNVNDNGVAFYDFGIPLTVYNGFFDQIVSYAGDWEFYDILITRLKDDPWYTYYHAVDDAKKFANKLDKVKGTLDFADRPLTEEEKSWERFDIDKVTKITSYKKIYERLKVFIQQVDAELKTKFFPELEALYEKEKKATEEAKKAGQAVDEDDVESKESEPTPEPAPKRSRPVSVETKAVDFEALKAKGFKGIDHLTEANKKLIIGIDENDQFQYSKDAGQIYACTDDACQYKSPESFTHCPKCGIAF